MAAGSATTYRHETGRDLTVEAKFIIPKDSSATLAIRRDTGGYNGYKVELTGGETRNHYFTERAYGYIDGAYGYFDSQLGKFKADCSIPTDSTSEPKLVSIVQSTTAINVYCGDVLVYEHKTTYFDTYGMQGFGASGDDVLIDDFKVSTTCNSGTQCDSMYTGESCEFECNTGYVAAANTFKMTTCNAEGEYD